MRKNLTATERSAHLTARRIAMRQELEDTPRKAYDHCSFHILT
jgi:hypothetical protein